MYDLIVRNGLLYGRRDGRNGAAADIAIAGGKICKIAPRIQERGVREIDVQGMTVTPGLIDFHAHFYSGGTGTALRFSDYIAAGVTNAVDAGSAGAGNIEAFLSGQTELERRNTKVYLYCATEGLTPLPDHDEVINPKFFNRKKIGQLCRQYPDRICSLKLRISAPIAQRSGVASLDALRAGVEIAEECRLPLSVHMPDFEGELGELIDILRPGDIFCHVFTPKKGIMAGEEISPEIVRGQKKGILMESACGKGHLGNRVAQAAFRAGFYPDLISGDFTKATYCLPPAGTLPFLMSRFMALGMPFERVLDCCTALPAKKMGLEGEIGCLKEGARANLAIFMRKQGRYMFDDVESHVVEGHEMLIPQATILEGEIAYSQLLYGENRS